MKSVYTGMMAAVMIAAATLTFTACSSEAEELLLPEVPEQTATNQNYTLTVNASKGEEGTRALTIDGNDIIASWTEGDVVAVYSSSDEALGTLTALASGANTTLTGTLNANVTIASDDVLTLKYLSPDYNSQEGTLASIAEKCDYAVATVTVNSVTEEGAISTTDAAFENQQAIVKFTLKDKNGTEINPTSFSVKYGDESIEITNIPSNTYTTNGAGVLYVAIPGGEEQDVVLKANVESTVYTFMHHGVKFENANYYPINVRMKWDELENPLTFEAKEDGATVTLKVGKYYRSPFPSLQYKIVPQREGESEWTTITIEKEKPISIPLTTGEKVLFKGINTNLSQSSSIENSFSISVEGDGFVYGNVMSLLYGEDFARQTSLPSNYIFANLFHNNTTIYNHPYKTLVLPTTTLKVSCYSNMFEGCSNLTSAPELPATTLAEACYYSMFKDCTGLTTAPKLPATTLTKGCYNDMFRGCTSLTKAPDLLAEVAVSNCYSGMFRGCSSLNSVRCYINPGSNNNSFTYYWLDDVASTGTFYAKTDAIWPVGANGIPSGWTRVDE